MVKHFLLVAAGILATAVCAIAQDSVKMDLVTSEAMPRLGGYAAQQIQLSPSRPDSATKLPAGLASPQFGTMPFRLASGQAKINVVLDAPAGQPSHFYLDANGNGDLTDDPAINWSQRSPTLDLGSAFLPIGDKDHPAMVHVVFYRFHDDPQRAQFANMIFYYRDYAMFGQITLAGKSYAAALDDRMCTGDFRGSPAGGQAGSGVELLMDTNNSGSLEMVPGKMFDARQPFNIGGITYELRNMTPSGQFSVARSSQTVAEIPPPPNLNSGQSAVPFTAQTMDGNAVHFPTDYKSRIVMLDFWATWCGPCMGEVPGVAAAYQKFHNRGFDVLGISLDNPDAADHIKSVMQQNNMVWPEVYDGKGWQAAIAVMYGIESIPHPILVDGDTGKIIDGTENDLRGDNLQPTIEKALAAKGK